MQKQVKSKKRQPSSRRISVSFPTKDYELVDRLADQKHVSTAWVVREAVREYLTKDTPLFRESDE